MTTTAKELPISGQTFSLEGDTDFLILPDQSSDKLPWIWYAPTLPGLPGIEEAWMFDRFLQAGIAIAGIDVGESFGDPQGRARYSSFYQHLRQEYNFSNKASLLARSRGGLMLYNWAAEHPDFVACIAGIYPVCTLISYPGLHKASEAYGMTEEQIEADLNRHNPVDRLEGLAEANVPVFFVHGDCDIIVPLEENSGKFAQRYQQLGCEIKLVVPKNQGHNLWSGFFRCQQLVDFVISHSK